MKGIFVNQENDVVRLIRFYDDGTVIGTSIPLTIFESSKQNLIWFDSKKNNSEWGKGVYLLQIDTISRVMNDHVVISFELVYEKNKILYSGYLINSEKIHLTFEKESKENNTNTKSFNWPSNEDYNQLVFNRFTSKQDKDIELKNYQGYLGMMLNFSVSKLLKNFVNNI